MTPEEINKLSEALKSSSPKTEGLYTPKNLNALVIAAIIGLVAFMWTSVTEGPKKTADLSQQIAVIQQTTVDTKLAVSGLTQKFDQVQKDQSDTKANVDKLTATMSAMDARITSNDARLSQLEKDTR